MGKKISARDLLKILPGLLDLAEEVLTSFADGKITTEEAAKIGEKAIALFQQAK